MQVTVTGRHVSVTNAVKVYAEGKLGNVVKKYAPINITNAHIILDVEKYRHIAEVEVHCSQTDMCAKTSSRDMYSSIDKVVDKICRQLEKFKTKYDKRRHNSSETIRLQEAQQGE